MRGSPSAQCSGMYMAPNTFSNQALKSTCSISAKPGVFNNLSARLNTKKPAA